MDNFRSKNEYNLVKTDMFNLVNCDLYQNRDEDCFMTIAQLAGALGYASKSGIENMLARYPYLVESEFSLISTVGDGTHTAWVPQETRIFTEDGIYEVSMLSQSPVGRKFRTWIRGVLKQIRKTGRYTLEDTICDIVDDKYKTPAMMRAEVNRQIRNLKDSLEVNIRLYAETRDNVKIFIEDECVANPDSKINQVMLQQHYQHWCGRHDLRPFMVNVLTKKICGYMGLDKPRRGELTGVEWRGEK